MRTNALTGPITVIARSGTSLRSGDQVSVHVLKRLAGSKWAVALGGQVYPARSDLELKPGDILRTQVERQGNRLTLRIRQHALGTLGISGGDKISSLIISSLLETRIPVNTRMLRRLQKLTEKPEKNKQRTARAVALLMEKNIDPFSRGAGRLLEILSLTGNSPDRRGGTFPEDRKRLMQELKKIISRTAGDKQEKHPVQVFNHLTSGKRTWIVVPYRFEIPSGIYCGALRLLFDKSQKRFVRFVLEAKSDDNDRWSFLLIPDREGFSLRVFCGDDDLRGRAQKKIHFLRSILRNHAVKCDDDIYDAELFDGYEVAWESDCRRNVDTFV